MLHYKDLKFLLKANKSINERASWNIFYAMAKEFNDYYMIKASGDGLINYTKILLQDHEKSMKSPQPNNSTSCLNNEAEWLSTALDHSIINPHNNHLQWKKRQLRFPVFATQVNQRAGPTLEMMSGSTAIIPSRAVTHKNNKSHGTEKGPTEGSFPLAGHVANIHSNRAFQTETHHGALSRSAQV